ncbi:MAG: hypothetical protein N2037_04005 [Acidimicrobiales bacterium]|nr:hypothetical protein [Acidimicrobiales bacterium]
MAKKVRCPRCGAKNTADLRRCRVCTAIINASAPEPGMAPTRQEAPSLDVFDPAALERTMMPTKSFRGRSGLSERLAAGSAARGTAESAWSGGGSAVDDPFASLTPPAPKTVMPEPTGYRPGGMAAELFGTPSGPTNDPADAIVIDVPSRHAQEVPPPELASGEHFDPNGLVIERDPLPPNDR